MRAVMVGVFATAVVITTWQAPAEARRNAVKPALLQAVVHGQVTVDELVQAIASSCHCAPRSGAAAGLAATTPSIDVGSVTGAPGDQVSFAVTLNAAGATVAGAQNDLAFDSVNTPVAATSAGTPDCSVNPAIGKEGTIFGFLPIGCTGTACTMIRAIVFSFSNVDPIPDGAVLYTCNVDIAASAAANDYPLLISNVVLSTPQGQQVPGVTGTDGAIVVEGGGSQTPTDKNECKHGGWRNFTSPRAFKNQGDCIQFVNTGK